MKKLIFLYLLSLALVNGFSAQQTEAPDSLLDTVHFDGIQIYNKITQKTFGLYTKRESIINFAEEEGRTFFIETSKVPFFRFPTSLAEYPNPAREFIAYIVFSDISKEKLLSEYILINHVRPNDNIILSIKHGSDIIILDKNTKPSDLASFFQKSYIVYENNRNIFKSLRLNVTKGTETAYIHLMFENNRFYSLWLSID